MKSMKRWRIYNRRMVVDRFQVRLAAAAVAHFAIVVVVLLAVLYGGALVDLVAGDSASWRGRAAAYDLRLLAGRAWLPLLGTVILLVLHNVLISHKIAGPLYRFRRYFKKVGEGDLRRPMEVRSRDYLRGDAEVISAMVESLRNRVALAAEHLERAGDDWAKLRASLPSDVSEALHGKIDQVERRLESSRRTLATFQLGDAVPPSPADAESDTVHPAELKV
jgi:methyl-accepting chemotaxis protein